MTGSTCQVQIIDNTFTYSLNPRLAGAAAERSLQLPPFIFQWQPVKLAHMAWSPCSRYPPSFLYICMWWWTPHPTQFNRSESPHTAAHTVPISNRNGPAEQQDGRGSGVPRRTGGAGGGGVAAGGVRVRLLR
jgi:hypothetical protein